MKREQSKPIEAIPKPLSESPQASPAVWVPWPTGSLVGALVPNAAAPAIRRLRSGWLPSTPLSTTATSAPVPRDRSQARGPPSRIRFHWVRSPPGACGSGCVNAKSFGE